MKKPLLQNPRRRVPKNFFISQRPKFLTERFCCINTEARSCFSLFKGQKFLQELKNDFWNVRKFCQKFFALRIHWI
eukprot:UN26447